MRLCSLGEIKSFLEKEDNTHDNLLLSLIEQVSSRIEKALNRQLSKAERIEAFDGDEKILFLSAYPVDLDKEFVVIRYGQLLARDIDYYVNAKEGVVELRYRPMRYERPWSTVVRYTGGYEEDADGVLRVPEALKRACMLQVAFEFKRRRDIGIRSITMPDGSISVAEPAGLLPEVKAIIDLYRRIVTA